MKFLNLLFLLTPLCVNATSGLKVDGPWVRETIVGQQVAGGYLSITSDSERYLTGGSSPLSESVEIHEMSMQGNVMKMRKLTRVLLKPGETISLRPGGFHLMLINIKKPYKPGDNVPITLRFENLDGSESEVNINAPVRSLDAAHSN